MLPSSYDPKAPKTSVGTPSLEVLTLAQSKYFLYPAQMWVHKNHIILIRAMKELVSAGQSQLKCVFTGMYSDYYTATHFQKLMVEVKAAGLEQNIHFVGFVSDVDLLYLYSHAQALLMPSYFGPSNLPPLEAINLNCPVLAGNCFGMNGYLCGVVDLLPLDDYHAWAEGMLRFLDARHRSETLKRNKKINNYKTWSKSVSQFSRVIELLTSD